MATAKQQSTLVAKEKQIDMCQKKCKLVNDQQSNKTDTT